MSEPGRPRARGWALLEQLRVAGWRVHLLSGDGEAPPWIVAAWRESGEFCRGWGPTPSSAIRDLAYTVRAYD